MRTRDQNLACIALVARGLADLLDRVVFVGGATVALYVDDPTASDARITDDVDCVIELSGMVQLAQFENQLRARGFRNAIGEGEPICRWRYSGVTVDIVPTDPALFGFSNRWYGKAMPHKMRVRVVKDVEVYTLPMVYLIATKFEAFHGRGEGDWVASHDIEDIVALMDGATDIETVFSSAEKDVREYVLKNFVLLLQHRDVAEILLGHLPSKVSSVLRRDRLMRVLRNIVP